VIVAVNQIGIAASIVNTLFMAVVFSVALAAALAFGLGGRDTAARIWEGWYTRGRDMAPRLDSGAQTAAQRVEEPSERRMAATDMRTEPTERRRSLRPSTE
jgi:hypothetical protein